MSTKKRGLGKGLEALLSGGQPAAVAETPQPTSEVATEKLKPGRYQPRVLMDEEELNALAESIRAQGIIQPIIVKEQNNHYEIIAGERRWRAAQIVGLKTVPVVIKNFSDKQATAVALIENIQREDLNPIEEARALEKLSQEFSLTQQEVAEAVGKSRVSVTHLLRLLSLPTSVKTWLEQKKLDLGHAKVLMGLPTQKQVTLAERVVKEGLSVRALESLLSEKPSVKTAKPKDPDVSRLEKTLSDKLGASVQILSQKGKGRLIIRFNSLDELEGILSHVH